MTHHNITTFGLALFLFLILVIIISCSKEPGKSAQPTNKVEPAAEGDTAVIDSSRTPGKENATSDVLSHGTAANEVEIKELIEKFLEEYRQGGGRSAKTMKMVRLFRSLCAFDALSVEQKLRLIEDQLYNYPRYIGAQGALLCLYSNIINDTRGGSGVRRYLLTSTAIITIIEAWRDHYA